jgi:hypothetical protein
MGRCQYRGNSQVPAWTPFARLAAATRNAHASLVTSMTERKRSQGKVKSENLYCLFGSGWRAFSSVYLCNQK